MHQLILYHQTDCHLCDEAESLLSACGLGESYQRVDIETDLELRKRYAILVPVLLRSETQQELLWPFDESKLTAFLQAAK